MWGYKARTWQMEYMERELAKQVLKKMINLPVLVVVATIVKLVRI